jgi:viroplasmin and RNaseH domain-containing protein
MNSQSDIELKTDVVMTNIINKNKRIIHTNKKFKLSDNDIKKIKIHANNNYIKKNILIS